MMMTRHKKGAAFLLAAALFATGAGFTSQANAGTDPIYTGFLNNLAVQGYDPVSYFTKGSPTQGLKDFSTEYKGAEFRFSSMENLETFKKNPDAYAPQYGGYCAWAISQGYTAKGDAQYWRIVDGKLYLNYSADVQKTWETDIAGFISKANTNWPTILKE